MSVYFDEIELRKNDGHEEVPKEDRVLILQNQNAKEWLIKLIEIMTLEQRFELLDYAQGLFHADREKGKTTTAEKINVLKAIEEASKKPNDEPLGDIIRSVMKR